MVNLSADKPRIVKLSEETVRHMIWGWLIMIIISMITLVCVVSKRNAESIPPRIQTFRKAGMLEVKDGGLVDVWEYKSKNITCLITLKVSQDLDNSSSNISCK